MFLSLNNGLLSKEHNSKQEEKIFKTLNFVAVGFNFHYLLLIIRPHLQLSRRFPVLEECEKKSPKKSLVKD